MQYYQCKFKTLYKDLGNKMQTLLDLKNTLHIEYEEIGGDHFNPEQNIDRLGLYQVAEGSKIDLLQKGKEPTESAV